MINGQISQSDGGPMVRVLCMRIKTGSRGRIDPFLSNDWRASVQRQVVAAAGALRSRV